MRSKPPDATPTAKITSDKRTRMLAAIIIVSLDRDPGLRLAFSYAMQTEMMLATIAGDHERADWLSASYMALNHVGSGGAL